MLNIRTGKNSLEQAYYALQAWGRRFESDYLHRKPQQK